MPHYNAYDSFKTKKSITKKQRAKEKSLGKTREINEEFLIENSIDFGIVIEVRYDDAYVIYENEIVLASLRKDINMVCNQVIFPGDKVKILKNDSKYIIQNLIKRTSLLTRVKKDSTKLNSDASLVKCIAANINLAVVVVAAKEPPLHSKFIDRYLMILQNSHIPFIICLNKCDLKTSDEDKILNVYRKIGIQVIEVSTYTRVGIDELKLSLRGKQAIFVGNSGVGKSSLTNVLMDDNIIKTNQLGEKSKRGRHTTTTSKYYMWDEDSSIIDTPGIRSLDVSSINPMEIQNYFSEFDNWKDKCKYNNCMHYKEPLDSCVVKQGVISELINRDRYESYLKIMGDILNDIDFETILNEMFRN